MAFGPEISFSITYLIPVAAVAVVAAWWLVRSGRRAREREQSAATAAARVSESRFRNLVESTRDLVWEIDSEGRYVYCSPQAQDVLGYAPAEIVGRTPLEMAVPDARHGGLRDQFRGLLEYPQPVARLEWTARHKTGRDVVLETSAMPVFDAGGVFRGYRGIDRDITERKQGEQKLLDLVEQLHETRRMEAIGRLAGGVAHDFNNLLTIILGSANYLQERLPDGHAAREEATAILSAAQRAVQLTQQLLTFSGRQVHEPRPIELNAIVSEMHGLLERLIGEDIQLELTLASSDVIVNADPAQLEQIVTNLAANARDAMPTGGRLTIATGTLDLTPDPARTGIRPGAYGVIAVTDTGSGIDPETQEHLFEPFFTTSQRPSGTGLGLAAVHGIVEQSGGSIRVRTAIGKGTTFEILLPLAHQRADGPSPAAAPVSGEMAAGTVLVAEDEPAVCTLLTRYLREYGFNVLVASLPDHALQLAASAGPIDLLVSDVIMPGMSGPALAKQLLTTRPAMKVLYVSGYPDAALIQHGIVESKVHLLQKPFSRDSFLQKVRAVLQPPASQGGSA